MANQEVAREMSDTYPPVRAAAVGLGDVATGQYLPYLVGCSFLDFVACADRDEARARAVAEEFNLRARSVDEILADPEIELILDLTPPLAHFAINAAALEAGKHVYTEKPLAATFEEAKQLIALAERLGRRIAGAPDTVLGPNLQLARELIDAGKIGAPYMASMS